MSAFEGTIKIAVSRISNIPGGLGDFHQGLKNKWAFRVDHIKHLKFLIKNQYFF